MYYSCVKIVTWLSVIPEDIIHQKYWCLLRHQIGVQIFLSSILQFLFLLQFPLSMTSSGISYIFWNKLSKHVFMSHMVLTSPREICFQTKSPRKVFICIEIGCLHWNRMFNRQIRSQVSGWSWGNRGHIVQTKDATSSKGPTASSCIGNAVVPVIVVGGQSRSFSQTSICTSLSSVPISNRRSIQNDTCRSQMTRSWRVQSLKGH